MILDKGVEDWSLAVLVPTKQLMLDVSNYLGSNQILQNGKKVPSIDNKAALDAAGPALAASTMANVLAGGATPTEIAQRLIRDLSNHMRGRKGGERPSQQQLDLADSLDQLLDTGSIRGSRRKALADECLVIAKARLELALVGDPGADWLAVRRLFEVAKADELVKVALDARFLKFLNRGAQLRSRLAEIWRSKGSYEGAEQAVDNALVTEHFATSKQGFRGVHVMTLHKSKGKQFTEVIIYEGSFQGRIVRDNVNKREGAQALLLLRVGVTRAEQFTSILTPLRKPCPFL